MFLRIKIIQGTKSVLRFFGISDIWTHNYVKWSFLSFLSFFFDVAQVFTCQGVFTQIMVQILESASLYLQKADRWR